MSRIFRSADLRPPSIIIAVVGVPGVLLGTALIEVPRIGRKWAMVGSSALMGASLFLYALVTTPAASVGFNAMEYFCACARRLLRACVC